jgi:hypothetical protein
MVHQRAPEPRGRWRALVNNHEEGSDVGTLTEHKQFARIRRMALDGAPASRIASRCGVKADAVNDYIAELVYGTEIKTADGDLADDPMPAASEFPDAAADPASDEQPSIEPISTKGPTMTPGTTGLQTQAQRLEAEAAALRRRSELEQREQQLNRAKAAADYAELDGYIRQLQDAERAEFDRGRGFAARVQAEKDLQELTDYLKTPVRTTLSRADHERGAAELGRYLHGLRRQEDEQTLRRAWEDERFRLDNPFHPVTAAYRQRHPAGCACRECGLLSGRIAAGDES